MSERNRSTHLRSIATTPANEQLTLFRSSVPERFRIDDATRRRGLRHIAEIRARLDARYPAKPATPPERAA